jgi:hypothetical protein
MVAGRGRRCRRLADGATLSTLDASVIGVAVVSRYPIRSVDAAVQPALGLSVPLPDDYLAFVAERSRPNTVLATAYDLRVFFASSTSRRSV